ncbi:MAG: hypothetical protein EXR67_07760 [Dehalococcoidia bacterium]|nr:hypothetical protein [Dehalococcoidia bacterium]
MTTDHHFGTAVTCVDGRVQQPVGEWVKNKYHVDYVDMVTEPGADMELSKVASGVIEATKKKVALSVNAHKSQVIIVAGHFQCAANPTTKEEHIAQIKRSAQLIASWDHPVPVVGLWINEHWKPEEVVTIKASGKA